MASSQPTHIGVWRRLPPPHTTHRVAMPPSVHGALHPWQMRALGWASAPQWAHERVFLGLFCCRPCCRAGRSRSCSRPARSCFRPARFRLSAACFRAGRSCFRPARFRLSAACFRGRFAAGAHEVLPQGQDLLLPFDSSPQVTHSFGMMLGCVAQRRWCAAGRRAAAPARADVWLHTSTRAREWAPVRVQCESARASLAARRPQWVVQPCAGPRHQTKKQPRFTWAEDTPRALAIDTVALLLRTAGSPLPRGLYACGTTPLRRDSLTRPCGSGPSWSPCRGAGEVAGQRRWRAAGRRAAAPVRWWVSAGGVPLVAVPRRR